MSIIEKAVDKMMGQKLEGVAQGSPRPGSDPDLGASPMPETVPVEAAAAVPCRRSVPQVRCQIGAGRRENRSDVTSESDGDYSPARGHC